MDDYLGLEKGIALYKFYSSEADEITLEEGDILDIVEEADDGWWKGIKIIGTIEISKEGIFPYNYLKKLTAMDYYQLSQDTAEQRLTFVQNLIRSSNFNSNNVIQKHNHNNHHPHHHNHHHQHQQQQQAENSTRYNNFKDETHIIASLSDPMEKRNKSGSSGNLEQQLDEQIQQDEILRLQRDQIDQQRLQNGGAITIKLNDVAKEGFLVKKGHIIRNWNVRWFQLKRNVLTYSKTPNDIKLSGTIILTKETEIDIATNMKRTNCFQIKNQAFVLYCSSQSQGDMESWISALNTAKNVH